MVDIVEGDDREKRGCRTGKRERAEREAGLRNSLANSPS
jgi:hypothetical protein